MDGGPIIIEVFNPLNDGLTTTLRTFSSYSFDKNILSPASAFRFTAPGIDKKIRMAIRSGYTISLFATGLNGEKLPIATGYIDETDFHVTSDIKEYVITGRDTLGSLVDNSAIDENNKIINTTDATFITMLSKLLNDTRIPKNPFFQQTPNGKFLFQTTPGESKINALQRYLEISNCLAWSLPDGRIVIGKPNFTQERSGTIVCNDTIHNNTLDVRVRRNLNQVARKVVTQLQTMNQVDAGTYTLYNNDSDMQEVFDANIGRSVYRNFSYGQGEDTVNLLVGTGKQSGNNRSIGNEFSAREIARDNMKILDIEVVIKGHLNEYGGIYNIDQIYNVDINDEDVYEDMYVYACSHELTMEHGMLTRLRLCRLGTICASADYLIGNYYGDVEL